MELEVKVTGASLDDVVAVAYDYAEETVTTTTLGDVIAKALTDRLTADQRWGDLAQRFADTADKYLADRAPLFIQALVSREVARQLADTSQGAVTRGKPSTRAEAIVATEVTTQLREQFAPVVGRALTGDELKAALSRLAAECDEPADG
jgi:hypothetical protein